MKDDLRINFIKQRNQVATWNLTPGRFLVLGLLVWSFSCNQNKDILNAPEYDGPLSSLDSATTLLSDSGVVVMKMQYARQSNFENGDREWPSGFEIEWSDKKGVVTTYFEANYVYYTKADNLYRAEGDVLVKSYKNGDELKTEELFWDQSEKTFYTEKFVTIKSDDELHTGEGLEANQDFTEYHIINPDGTFTLEDDPNRPASPSVPLVPAEEE